jgi:oligopeptide/dipeptide ABC transporter ATP-binding protein
VTAIEPVAAPALTAEPLLRLDGVAKYFPVRSGSLISRHSGEVRAVDGVTLEVRRGETLGLVGETGCGKSTLARCIARLCDVTAGRIEFDGEDVTSFSSRRMRAVRRNIQVVFQDPYGSLNPRRRVGAIIGDPFAIHGVAGGDERKARVQEVMELVGLNPEHYNRFPAEFSGGQRQRIGLARALALKPKLIICDEPVSALDVSIQAQIINLLDDLQKELGLTYIFISHDLSVVRHVSSRIAVMYLGRVAEIAPTEPLYRHPRHPYTEALQSAIPVPDPDVADRRTAVILSDLGIGASAPAGGCSFRPRCSRAQQRCTEERPELLPRLTDPQTHLAACHFAVPDADRPEVQIPLPRRARRVRAPGAADGPDGARAAPGGASAVPDDSPAAPGERQPAAAAVIRGRGPWQLAWGRLRHDRAAMAAGVVILAIVALALGAPLVAAITGHGNLQQFPTTGRTADGLPVGPSGRFWLGTDELGRDLLVRIAYWARISLLVGALATAITVAIGVVIGLMAGYLGSLVDTLFARLIDVMLSIPFLLFAVSLASVFHPGLTIVIVVLAIFGWSSVARIVRGQVLSIREREYIDAARSLGAGTFRIMFVDILPNVAAPIIVYTTLLIPISIVGEATLSFLGVGVQPPTADWGQMLSTASTMYQQAWWYLVFPGLALLITTVAFNIFGDGVRDAFDPNSHDIPRAGAR